MGTHLVEHLCSFSSRARSTENDAKPIYLTFKRRFGPFTHPVNIRDSEYHGHQKQTENFI